MKSEGFPVWQGVIVRHQFIAVNKIKLEKENKL